MSHHSSVEVNQVKNLGKKFETLALVDRLMEENEALKHELNLKTARLRTLQKAVHAFLMGTDNYDSNKAKLIEESKE
ncbi:MAG: hypothetical protein LW710_10525 [Burkholderiales bacterium]|jgi:hypothetical protein|uniref:hypothetical protein n=1 Tax=Limnobacter sp. TaxID=2003368 RepID=UPI0039BCC5DE|nr:hypothetical protein [Burkholderiales bacterium]